jgi:hypothetical protein
VATNKKPKAKPSRSDETAELRQRLAEARQHRDLLINTVHRLAGLAAAAPLAEALPPTKLSRAQTDAIVEGCIDNAASPGAVYDDGTQLKSIPVRPDDLNGCLNSGLDLVNPYRYTSGVILPTWTVLMLKTDAYNKYYFSHR